MRHKVIDPHVHFFNLPEGQYTWLQGATPPAWPNLAKIKQPVTAAQLQQSCPFELTALVHIEAGFDNQAPINELNWLSQHLKSMPYKAIAYAAIDQPHEQFKRAIAALQHPSLVGIRDITEGEQARRLLQPHCGKNLAYLAQCNLHFEAQFPVELLAISESIARYAAMLSHLTVVINHCGLVNNIAQWQQGIAALAPYKNILIKYSGFELLTLSAEQQAQCFEYLLTQFGEQRIMFASNFPVCQIEQSYQQLWHAHFALCKNLSQWRKMSYHNAQLTYRL